jgi:hypothetical protein
MLNTSFPRGFRAMILMKRIRCPSFAPLAIAVLLLICDAGRAQDANAADPRAAQALRDEMRADRDEAKADGAKADAAMKAMEAFQSDEALALLQKAVKAMDGKVWRVDGRIQGRTTPAMKWEQWGDWGPVGSITGLVSGDDFDLTQPGSGLGARRIAIKDHEWTSGDGGKTWAAKQTNADFPNFAVLENRLVGIPLPILTERLQFELAGTEKHDDGTWAHIRSTDASAPLDYWILLDAKGEPAGVRRIVSRWDDPSTDGMRLREKLFTVDLTPAKEGEKITPPQAVTQGGK